MARSGHSSARDAVGQRGGRSVGEAVALVAVGVVLLCVAAWSASRSTIGDSSPSLSTNVRGSQAALNDVLLVAAGALAAALVILVLPAFFRQGRGRAPRTAHDETRAPLWLRLLVGVAVILIVVSAILLAANTRPQPTEPPPAAPVTTEPVRAVEGERAGARGWAATSLFAAGALVVVVAVVIARRRGRRRGSYIYEGDPMVSQPVEPLDLEALGPADAVRAAYGAAKASLEELGVPIRAPETPYEYLDRVRESATSAVGPATTLTRLFEIARFSHHPVSAAMKAEAIAAYTVIADEATRAREATRDDEATHADHSDHSAPPGDPGDAVMLT